MARPGPFFYWVNRYDPYMIRSEKTAHDGTLAIMAGTPTGSKGKIMLVSYRLATRAQVLAWKALSEGFTTFATTSIHANMSFGHTVTFSRQNPLTYQNELGLQDIDIGDSDTFTDKPGFDYWRGIMTFIIIA